MQQVISLKDIKRDDLEAVGEKVYELSRLDMYDVKVPNGFCITTAVYMRYMMPFMSQVRKIDQFMRKAHMLRAAAELREAMNDIKLAPDTIAAVKVAIRELSGGQPLVARPCVLFRGTGETVFTGKCPAFFHVTEENVEETIIKCWQQLFSDDVVVHKARVDAEGEDVEMAILIQQIIEGLSAGKMYTASPHNNDNAMITIQAGHPNRHKVLFQDHYEEEYEIYKESFALKKPKQDGFMQQIVEDEKLVSLAKLGLEVQGLFGQARVVEWVLDRAGQIWVVQCNAMSGWYPACTEEAVSAKKKKDKLYIYLGGVLGSGEIFSELGQSVISRISPAPIYHFGGRPYIELRQYMVGTGCLSDMIFDLIEAYDCRTAEELKIVAGMEEPGDKKKEKRFPGFRQVAEFTLLEAKLKREIKYSYFDQALLTAREKTEVFLRTAEERIASQETLYDKFQELDSVLSDIFSTILKELFLLSFIGLDSLNRLRSTCEAQAIDPDLADTLTGAAVQGVSDEIFESFEHIFKLFQDSAEEKQLEEIFDRSQEQNIFSYRTYQEALPWLRERCGDEIAVACRQFFEQSGFWSQSFLDIRYDNWQEKPSLIFEVIRENIKGSDIRRGRENAEEAAELLCSMVNKKNKKLIENIRCLLPVSVLPAYIVARLIHMIKPLAEAAGEDFEKNRKLLYDRRDITYLRLDEIMEAMKTSASVAGRIMQRKKERKQNRRLSPPSIMLADGVIPEELFKRDEELSRQTQWKYLQGRGTSLGQAEGVARVVRDMNRVRLAPGEILVVPSMNMGFAPLAFQAGGIVSECGGAMSAGNILCMERKIPAVAGVFKCTQIIHSGDLIRIDGRSGTVVKL